MVKTNYQMKRTLLLAVFGLLAAAVSATDFTCTPEGGLATEGARLVITPYCAGWNSAGVQGTWDNLDCPDRPFRIMDGDSCLFEGNSQWVAEGSLVVGHILLTCQNDCDMESLSMALLIPQSRTRGKALNADGETFTLPLNSNLTLTTCTVPLPQGRTLTLSWDAPTLCHAEDLSQWGDEWTLRIGQWQTRHTFRKGDKVAWTLRVATSDGITLRRAFEKTVLSEGERWTRLINHKDILAGSALDFSHQGLQDAPAGKHGWLKAIDGHFEFEGLPGVEQRFYGVNLCFSANYPSHEVADILTDRLVRLGYNTIRIHHHDDTWGKGGNDNLDRLDYLLAKAIEKGLYVTTDMYVSRQVTWRELGVDREGYVGMDLFKSLVGCYDPAFDNWCTFSKTFMEHVNPYTGRAYKDEPGMPLLSMVNEGELFMGFSSKQKEPLMQQIYREYIGRDEPLTSGTPGYNAFAAWLEQRIASRCMDYMRSLGCRALLTNDNNGNDHGEGESATPLFDYVDNHFYIDHPQFVAKSWSLPSRCANSNPVLSGGPALLRKGLAKGFSKPYTITEWNFSGPGRYRGLGGVLTGTKAAVQDWDGLWRFAYSHSREDLEDDPTRCPGYFDVATDPLSQASDRASVCLFLRGDATSEEQLDLDTETGVMRLSTPRTCALFADGGTHQAGLLKAILTGAPATVCLTTLDGRDATASRHMLLSHITDVQGDGTTYGDAERTLLLAWGTGALIENGEADIVLARPKTRRLKVYELSTSGERVRRLPVKRTRDTLTFHVSTRNPDGEGRIYYEITSR